MISPPVMARKANQADWHSGRNRIGLKEMASGKGDSVRDTDPAMPGTGTDRALPVGAWLLIVLSAGVGGYAIGSSAGGGNSEPPSTLTRTGEVTEIHHLPAAASRSESIADVAQEAMKCVVSLEVAAPRKASSGPDKLEGFFFGPKMRPSPDFPRPHGRYGTGAGIIIRPDGFIVTSNHIVRFAEEVRVTLADGRQFMARKVAGDAPTDLALIKIPSANLPCARFADSATVRPGEWAIAIGSPMSLKNSLSVGVISAVERCIGNPFPGTALIQTDAAINPGNSGGPLLNMKGEVIGVNCVVRSDAQNIGFAIPSRTVTTVIKQLQESGKVSRGYVGVRMEEVKAESLEGQDMVRITHVVPGSPASESGLRVGDEIMAVAGVPTITYWDVKKAIAATEIGNHVSILVKRGVSKKQLDVKVEPLPGPE